MQSHVVLRALPMSGPTVSGRSSEHRGPWRRCGRETGCRRYGRGWRRSERL